VPPTPQTERSAASAEALEVPMAAETPSIEQSSLLQFCFVRIPHVLTGVIFLVAAIINIANVIGRYLFSAPIFWAEEVLVFMVIWAVFLSAISITFNGAHLSMDLFYTKLQRPWKQIVNGLIVVVFLACTVGTAIQSFAVVRLYIGNGNVSPAAEIPLYIPHAALLVGFSFMALAVICRLKAYFSGTFG
jgi:TRAP-type C4-dicarboxylate transport system permease small subunit